MGNENKQQIYKSITEIVQMQGRYVEVLQSVSRLVEQEQEKNMCLDVLGQISEFLAYVYEVKKQYYGRPLDWAEEYAFALVKECYQDIVEGQFTEVGKRLLECAGYIQKSREELEEILQVGTYNVDLGKMQLCQGSKPEDFANRDEMVQALEESSMNPLEQFFFCGKHNKMTKWCHYFEVYHRHFERFRHKPVTILEIGVWGGGSLQMWKDYFGTECNIIGIDIMEECKNYEEERIKIYIGSQEDREFLRKVKDENPGIDIIIDDGGHTMNQQIATFEELYPHLAEDGVYLCEDLMTSYWQKYGGGYKKPGTFIEYSKNFIDALNARYSLSTDLKIDSLTSSIRSVHYYDSMIVLEKGAHKPAMVL